MFNDLETIVVKNVLLDQTIDWIYNKINELDKSSAHIVKELGHTTYFMDFNDGFKKYMHSKIQPYFDVELEITEMAFARYHHDSGYVPKLFPHFDHFKEHRITFDLQLKSTIEWPIVVEGKEFLLNNNDALIFSGTDQIHWRKDVQLSKEDEVDMFFIHLSVKDNNVEISEKEKHEKLIRLNSFIEKVNISQQPIKSGE